MKITKRHIRYLLIVSQALVWVAIIWATIPISTRRAVDTMETLTIPEIIWVFIPYIVLINVNWYYLAPRFLKKGSYRKYALFVGALILVCATAAALNQSFMEQNDLWLIFGESERELLIPGIFTMTYVLFVVYILSMPFYLSLGWFDQQSKIDKLESENLRTELDGLKDQINPHFFFNTLNNLYALTLSNSEKAPEVILKLSELMHYVIYDGSKSSVTIQEEVDYLESYFDIQKLRRDQQAEIRFESQVDDSSTRIVPLLFINLLENAFKHGTDSMTKGGTILCTLLMENRKLTFRLKNRYEGYNSKEEGLGLTNLKRRLALAYQNSHSLTITDENGIFDVSLVIDKTDDLPHS
ncbi:MAG TPA: sensor histidine kinase [Cryomorphaceae bacterium]|nr:sensor histidine kinase [Cryomorphaceae bacterium]